MSEVDLTIVVVSYNTRRLTLACLRSVFERTTGILIKVVVADNASSDGSVAAIEAEFPHIEVIELTENVGFARANNLAIESAQGRYILLLNSDTVVLGDVIERSVQYMDIHADVGVLGCRVLNTDHSVQRTCFLEPSLLNTALLMTGLDRLPWPRFFGRQRMADWQRDSERDVEVVTGCYMMVREIAFRQIGLLDETFFFCGEETDWCRRFRVAGWVVRFAPVGEIIHVGNASGRRHGYRRDLLLTTGLVRFHLKHGGVIGGAIAWSMLWMFNASRWGFWTVAALLFPHQAHCSTRREHFRQVVSGFGEVWRNARTMRS